MGPIETVVWGAISGIVTTIALALLSFLFKKGIIPWYQKFIYKGVDLNGSWILKESGDGGITYTCHLNMSQIAHKVTGHASIAVINSNHDYNQMFDVDGETWEGFLSINMRSKDNTTLSFVSGLLKVQERGAALSGSWSYRGFDNDVKQELVVFRREKSKDNVSHNK